MVDPNRITGMTHLNGNLLCAVFIETTGSTLFYHDICQIGIIPINYNLDRQRNVLPFFCNIIPQHKERIDPKTMSISQDKMNHICNTGLNYLTAADLIEKWFDRFELNSGKRIVPLTYNWVNSYPYMCKWLTQGGAEYIFDYRHRDILPISLYLNDYHDYRIENLPFAKNDLAYVFSAFGVERYYGASKSCLTECKAIIDLYKAMVSNINVLELITRQVIKEQNALEPPEDKKAVRQYQDQQFLESIKTEFIVNES